MEPSSRRMIGRFIRAGLVVLAICFAGVWLFGKLYRRNTSHLPSRIVKVETLEPGDVRVLSLDSAVSVTLQGQQLLAGLSPATVSRIRAELDTSAAKDTSGLKGSIAQMVKKTVAENISAQLAYPIDEIAEVRQEGGLLVLVFTDGKTKRLFDKTKVGEQQPRFASEDLQRVIEAFRSRKHQP